MENTYEFSWIRQVTIQGISTQTMASAFWKLDPSQKQLHQRIQACLPAGRVFFYYLGFPVLYFCCCKMETIVKKSKILICPHKGMDRNRSSITLAFHLPDFLIDFIYFHFFFCLLILIMFSPYNCVIST